MNDNVLQFPGPDTTSEISALTRPDTVSNSDRDTGTIGNVALSTNATVRELREDALVRSEAPATTLDKLYPLKDEFSPTIAVAAKLLTEAIDLTESAIAANQSSSDFAMDDYANQLLALMPELFCFRDFGDGYAAIVVAVHHGLRNRESDLLTEAQLTAIKFALKKLSVSPFIDFEDAISLIEYLTQSSLEVELKELEAISDVLTSDA